MNPTRHHRAMEIFQAALDAPLSERAALLDRRCAGDDALRADVESLLAHHDARTISIEPDLTRIAARVESATATAYSGDLPTRIGARVRAANRPRMWLAAAALGLATFLSLLSWWMYQGIRQRLRDNLAGQLQATLESNVAAVDNWIKLRRREMEDWGNHPHLVLHFRELQQLDETGGLAPNELVQSKPYVELAELLSTTTERPEMVAVSGILPTGKLVFNTSNPSSIPRTLTSEGRRVLEPIWRGHAISLPPTAQGSYLEEPPASLPSTPLMSFGGAVRDPTGAVIGAIVSSVRSGDDFTTLLDLGRAGPRGDTYAFSKAGQLLSKSRYEPQLREIGILENVPDSSSVLNVWLRDPGANLTLGEKPVGAAETGPLTKMAAAAAAGVDGMDLDGYRDYRGVEVVGAWKWLDEHGFGVATEIERDQAYAALDFLKRLAGGVIGLLSIFGVIAFASAFSAARLRREVDEARQLGQYTVEALIGEGGMGRVYRARHAMLARPTAIKTLDGPRVDKLAVQRFEREVQLVSSLTHPNTIEIYDFGRTTDGVFYFAMEYIDGLTLDQLSKRDGPIPYARVLALMEQVLGSLAEAHDRGLIHRDIKPANIMLCKRGGVPDRVKVVDFGLAKDIDSELKSDISQTGAISGTPQYIAPEYLKDVSLLSPAADVYAVGATAFKLITGRDLFQGSSIVDILSKVLRDDPPQIADVAPGRAPRDVDELVSHFVQRDPQKRPRNARVALELLEAISIRHPWTHVEADAWWSEYDSAPPTASDVDTKESIHQRAATTIDFIP